MKPSYLNKTSKIYLIAPSFGCTTHPYVDRLPRAIERFKEKGHTVVVGPNCFLAKGQCASNTPLDRKSVV